MSGNIKKHMPHSWNVICDVCGRKRKNFETTLAYGSGEIPIVVSCLDGCADYRHPLNSPPPVIIDSPPVPDSRPDINVTVTYQDLSPFVNWGSFYGNPKWGSFPVSLQLWGKFTA